MTISKKLIGSLLCIGLSIAFASLGGIKLNDTIGYYRKINYYSSISKRGKDKSPTEFKSDGYYFPNGEDGEVGARAHDELKGKFTSLNPYDTWPTPESFRDFCYKHAEDDKDLTTCSSSEGGCEQCARKKEGDAKS